jgi:hypothetical protein
MTRNRRQFSRIPFQTEAQLFLTSGEFTVQIVDLSLKGALIKPPADFFTVVGSNCTLKIRLDNTGSTIRMECAIVHHQGHHYGLACRDIDLDSMTHLRRLLELNLGDESLLERDIGHLAAP